MEFCPLSVATWSHADRSYRRSIAHVRVISLFNSIAPKTQQMGAVAAESASELSRSGRFELIFPVGRSARKYFQFFDDSCRPLERMLAVASSGENTDAGSCRRSRGRGRGVSVQQAQKKKRDWCKIERT